MTSPHRVLYLSATGLLGGAEQSLVELLRAMPKDRVEAHVACPGDGPMLSVLRESGVAAQKVSFRRYRRTLHPFLLAGQIQALFRSSGAIQDLCKELGVHLIHANSDSAALVAWEVCRTGQWPFVWHSRDMRPLGMAGRLLGARATRVIAISGAVAAHLAGQKVPREKLRLVPNGIDLSRYSEANLGGARAAIRQELGFAPDAPILIDVGMFVPWKRHEDFLATLHVIRKNRPQVLGLVAGEDLFDQNEPYSLMLKLKAKEFGLGDSVRFLGFRSDVPRLLAASDIFVSTSEHEPFGRAVVEAMAAGLPVVSTYSGAKGEILQDGETGILTPQGQVGALVAACERLLDDEPLRRRFGERARQVSRERFDIAQVASGIASVYDEILAERKPG